MKILLKIFKKLFRKKGGIQGSNKKSSEDAEKEFRRWASDFNKRFM